MADESLQLTRSYVECPPEDPLRQAFLDCGEIVSSSFCFFLFASLPFDSFNLWWFSALSPLLGLSLQLCLVVLLGGSNPFLRN